MQRRGGSGQSVKEQRTTRPKTSQSADHTRVRRWFPALIVIDDKGNDFFKDLNLG